MMVARVLLMTAWHRQALDGRCGTVSLSSVMHHVGGLSPSTPRTRPYESQRVGL